VALSEKNPDLTHVLHWAFYHAANVRASLTIMVRALSFADTLMTSQRLPLASAQALVGEMRDLRETLRTVGHIIESWDESQICLQASAPQGQESPR
jgi:hypothetical protein